MYKPNRFESSNIMFEINYATSIFESHYLEILWFNAALRETMYSLIGFLKFLRKLILK